MDGHDNGPGREQENERYSGNTDPRGWFGTAGKRKRLWKEKPVVTWILIAVNVLVFLIGCFTEGGDVSAYIEGAGSNVPAMKFGMLTNSPDWYRVFTCGFIHFGLLHLASNMISLFFFGLMLENTVGHGKYALIYFVSLTGGGIAANLFGGNGLHAGASGAIWGLMAMALILCIKTQQSPLYVLRGILFNLIYTFAAGASWQGHIGGGIAGLIASALLLPSIGSLQANSEDRYSKWLYGDFERIYNAGFVSRQKAIEDLSPADRERYREYAAYRKKRDLKKKGLLIRNIAVCIVLIAAVNIVSYKVNRNNARNELISRLEFNIGGINAEKTADRIMKAHSKPRWNVLYITWETDYDSITWQDIVIEK